jgi:peptidoglycan biosynthesis protein MviN/MurJ (putative lipid II flippase)
VILLFALRKRFDNTILNGLGTTFIKTIIATLVMFAAGSVILKLLSDWEINLLSGAVILAIMVVSCSGIYIIISRILKNEMLGLVSGRK